MVKTLVYSDLLKGFDNDRVAYCYQGRYNRGSIALYNGDKLIIIKPKNYVIGNDDLKVEDNSKFELWCFIDEIGEGNLRQEAVNRLFDVYCNLYYLLEELRDYNFKLE